MTGYTENQIVVCGNFEHVFKLTNRIDLWPKLFTEYEKAQILSQENNTFTFQLTTHPEGERPSRTWTSERTLFPLEKKAVAKRLSPTFPFEYMNIIWLYEPLAGDQWTVMTWIQEFNVHPDCLFSNVEMESFLNTNTRKQMRAVKMGVENWKGED